MILTLQKHFSFEASHVLPLHPGKCSRLHGHSWKLVIGVAGPVNKETGLVVDYSTLSALVKDEVVDNLDHRHLGQGDVISGIYHYPAVLGGEFYPSSENLVMAIVKILAPLVAELGEPELYVEGILQPSSIQLVEVSLDETCTCSAAWRVKYVSASAE